MNATDHSQSRRAFLGRCRLVAGMALVFLAPWSRAAPSPTAIAAIAEARDRELMIQEHYVAYAAKARADGYRGIAYLFSALARSEGIHAQNHARVLASLGVTVPVPPRPPPKVGTTRENLLAGVRNEIHDIEKSYPSILKRLEGEDVPEAVQVTRYAWQSERQHRDLIESIRRWSDAFFETVARTIDARTGRYYVCAICGSMQHRVPKERCPICGQPPGRYALVEPPSG